MNPFTNLLLAATFTVFTLSPILAADSGTSSENTSAAMPPMLPGINVGDHAPAFTLKNAAGTDVSLAGLLARGKVALVFYRSADWCPFCIGQLKELQANLTAFEQAGIAVIGISYDTVGVLARSMKKHGVTFPLLSDEGSKTIDAFGIRDEEAKSKGDGIPYPAIFIVDQKGLIRAKLMHKGYRTRPTPAEIVAAAKGIM
jgi:peroxiredoxin